MLLFDVFPLSSVVYYSCLIIRQLEDLLVYLSISMMGCISFELLYICQTVGEYIGKQLPGQATPIRSHKPLSDRAIYISHAFQIVRRARRKLCSKSHIALFLLYTHLYQFYLLYYILLQLLAIPTTLYTSIKDSCHNNCMGATETATETGLRGTQLPQLGTICQALKPTSVNNCPTSTTNSSTMRLGPQDIFWIGDMSAVLPFICTWWDN